MFFHVLYQNLCNISETYAVKLGEKAFKKEIEYISFRVHEHDHIVYANITPRKKNQSVKVGNNQELKYSLRIVQQHDVERETHETRGWPESHLTSQTSGVSLGIDKAFRECYDTAKG